MNYQNLKQLKMKFPHAIYGFLKLGWSYLTMRALPIRGAGLTFGYLFAIKSPYLG